MQLLQIPAVCAPQGEAGGVRTGSFTLQHRRTISIVRFLLRASIQADTAALRNALVQRPGVITHSASCRQDGGRRSPLRRSCILSASIRQAHPSLPSSSSSSSHPHPSSSSQPHPSSPTGYSQ
ncbi:unnamed protein product [Pleuronectes platessa]|uniref:Uncharacterized protein n=1 Tax=Pleuronectes platessa TaxID=8262 RepID=A0A9N7TG35_PLEPL|nr:unnamed protein product [Pleuronectes platessa]